MTFTDVMEFTRTISSNAAFEDNECLAYYDVLMSLKPGNSVVEVGLEYGRSSSIALQVANERGLRYHGIDPWIGHYEVMKSWIDMARMTGADYTLSVMKSGNLHRPIGHIDCLLIDGDHTFNGVVTDCKRFLPMVNLCGFALFHDYGRESLPEVKQAVDAYMQDYHCESAWTKTIHGSLAVMEHFGISQRD